MGVGTVMSVVFMGWFASVVNPSHARWYAYLPGLLFLLGCVATASAVIAMVSANPNAADKRDVRGKMLDVIASAATFAISYSFVGFVRHHSVGGFGALNVVSWGVFLGFFFVLI